MRMQNNKRKIYRSKILVISGLDPISIRTIGVENFDTGTFPGPNANDLVLLQKVGWTQHFPTTHFFFSCLSQKLKS